MPRVGVSNIRKKQLIEATIAAIHAHGYDDTTMAKIAKRAGMSPGLIAHYFGSKDELLEATMRSLLTDLQALVSQRLAAAGRAPRARLEAIVGANFDESQCARETVSAWLAFWGQVPHVPALGRLQRVYARRLHSNLKREFGRLGVAPQETDYLAEVTASLIDGVWMRAGLSGGGLDTVGARRLVGETIDLHLAARGIARAADDHSDAAERKKRKTA
ncbi:transcriptional regulator BetI [Salinarimonas ramus]|uniref:HTH-type transcriptional regulator BetI n=1 Tax=Salinarimonas ramus TaxID=690164 RepID=A0A917QC62_9HYPH|nr:transcriptional regulator BetI [Salinarimonas ramus]GGK43901.1 HTH-type transcriptional regulator BetI [Salinarimonas ramus]